MAKKKVIFVITKSNWGGAQRYVYDLATLLPKDYFETLVVGGGEGELVERLRQASVSTVSLAALGRDINLLDDIRSFFSLWRIFRRERPDIVHLNSSKIGGLGALAGRLAGVRNIIFTAHGWAFNEPRPRWQKIIMKFLSWLTVIFCHRVIAVSRTDWAALQSKKIRLIHNGIGDIRFLDRAEARARLGIKPEKFVVGTIAELTRNKGLVYLPSGTIVIGEGDLRPELEKRLTLRGHIPDAARLLKAFDIFVLPSIKEGLPYVLLEAGLAGLPVVASDIGGIPEIIEHEKTGLLTPSGDPVTLARAIARLENDPALRQTLAANLQTKVQKEFSTERMVRETIAVYNG